MNPYAPECGSDTAIRCPTTADAEAINLLITQLGYRRTVEETRATLGRLWPAQNATDSPDLRELLLVAERAGGGVCGWLQAHASEVLESGFRVEIVGLVVADHARRRGVGRQLVTRAEQWAREVGAKSLVVRSNVTRAESHAFYQALGFQIVKQQVVYRKALPQTTKAE